MRPDRPSSPMRLPSDRGSDARTWSRSTRQLVSRAELQFVSPSLLSHCDTGSAATACLSQHRSSRCSGLCCCKLLCSARRQRWLSSCTSHFYALALASIARPDGQRPVLVDILRQPDLPGITRPQRLGTQVHLWPILRRGDMRPRLHYQSQYRSLRQSRRGPSQLVSGHRKIIPLARNRER